jgi:hypothetical protein
MASCPAPVAQDLVVYETVPRRKDGSLVHVSASRKRILNAGGTHLITIYTKKDVTDLKVARCKIAACQVSRAAGVDT